MARFGWFLLALGLTVSAGSAAWFAWVTVFDPTGNHVGAGVLFTAGFWVGLTVASCGAAAVDTERAAKAPPA